MFCNKCGEKNPDDSQFCIKCGLKMSNDIKDNKKEKEDIAVGENDFNNENAMMKNSNNSKKVLIIVFSIVGGLIVIGIVILLLWLFVFKRGVDTYKDLSNNVKDNVIDNFNNNKDDNKDNSEGDKEEVKQKSGLKILLYKSVNSEYISSYNSSLDSKNYYDNDNFTNIGNYECYSNNCIYKDGYGNLILVYDDGFILYDINTKEEVKLNIDVDSSNNIRFIYYDKKAYGLSVLNNNKFAYYDLNQNKYITGFEYSGFNSDGALKFNMIIGYKMSDFDDIGMYSDGNYYLINVKNGNIEYNTDIIRYFGALELNNHIYYSKLVVDNEVSNREIYNDKLVRIVDNVKNVGLIDNGNIMIENDKNGFNIYNSTGNLVKESKEYTKIMLIVDNYVAVIDNGYLKLIDSNEKEVANFTSWNDNMKFHSMISGYYNDSTSKVHGVYLVVEDESIPDGTKGRGKEYYYGTENGEVGVIELEYVGGYAKPVLYLYPEVETNVEVTFEKQNMLTTTYPKYINKWNVKAFPNGDLYDENGRYYYALYWEEIKNHDIDFSEGFYVTKENAIKFLEEKLDIIGFTQREANEFIMYWLPILESNGQSLVYFELTGEREAYNRLNISPKPDSMLRVAMHVKKVNNKVDIKEQQLDTFNRVGFSAIEWGGIIH